MPVRSLSSAVHKWPADKIVVEAVRAWAKKVSSEYPEVAGIGYIGSYARGDWGHGSDLDIVIVFSGPSHPQIQTSIANIPVPVDILLYSEEQLHKLLSGNSRFAKVLRTECKWLST
jgi:uncharacterized protein